MWVLFLFLLVNGQVVGYSPLETYPTKEVCMAEHARVQAEMEAAYPTEKDGWKLECLTPRKPTA